jgi:hypothetical protein
MVIRNKRGREPLHEAHVIATCQGVEAAQEVVAQDAAARGAELHWRKPPRRGDTGTGAPSEPDYLAAITADGLWEYSIRCREGSW